MLNDLHRQTIKTGGPSMTGDIFEVYEIDERIYFNHTDYSLCGLFNPIEIDIPPHIKSLKQGDFVVIFLHMIEDKHIITHILNEECRKRTAEKLEKIRAEMFSLRANMKRSFLKSIPTFEMIDV